MDITSQFETVVLYILFILFISGSVSNLRLKIGRRWVSVATFIFTYIFCILLAIEFGYLSHLSDKSLELRKQDFCEISKEFGKDMSLEKQNKISHQLAQYAFIHGGYVRSYIDLNGKLREYQPSKEDRQNLALWESENKKYDQLVSFYFWNGVILLVIPLLGVGIGFTGFNEYIKKLANLKI
ncbi:MAG: hypothetical protein K8R50_08585 [Betaproteobacteria bacterium]|nr:hypothetical protein [Betaproteobacteria bacterium]